MNVKIIPEDIQLHVVDVGARGGVHPRWLDLGSKLRAIMFEPDLEEYERLKAKSPENWLIIGKALGRLSGQANFHLLKMGGASSLLSPDERLLSRYPDLEDYCQPVKTFSVELHPLDILLSANNVERIDFIKLDTQGSELDILKGGSQYLESTIGIETEVEFIRIYKEQPLFADVDDYVRSLGFDLIDLRRYYWQRKGPTAQWSRAKGQLAYGDALYFRSPETVCDRCITEKDLWIALIVYLAYGYVDLAYSLIDLASNRNLVQPTTQNSMNKLLESCKTRCLPTFRGKNKIYGFLSNLTQMFFPLSWSTSDRELGN